MSARIVAALYLCLGIPAAEPADWYLHGNSGSWNTMANWWSDPVGGTNPGSLNGADSYHLKRYGITTPELTISTTFAGGTLIVDGRTGSPGPARCSWQSA